MSWCLEFSGYIDDLDESIETKCLFDLYVFQSDKLGTGAFEPGINMLSSFKDVPLKTNVERLIPFGFDTACAWPIQTAVYKAGTKTRVDRGYPFVGYYPCKKVDMC